MEDELLGWSADELTNLVSQFGADAAKREATRAAARAAAQTATSAGTSAATQTGMNATTGGLGSVWSSVATPIQIAMFIDNFFGSRRDARQAEAAAQYEAAMQGLQAAGVNPFEIYSPDVVSEMLYTPEGMATLAGLYPGDINMALESGQVNASSIAQELAFGLVSDFMRNPQMVVERFGTPQATPQDTPQTTAPVGNQLTNPVDYGRDVLDTAAGIWDDPSSVLGVIFGPGGITGNVEWGGGTIDNAPGSAPAVYTGKIGDKVYTGATTGIPVVDAALRRVLGQTEGGETSTWDVVTAAVEQATGYPASTVSEILEDVFTDSGPSLPSPGPTSPTGGVPSTTAPQDQTGGVTVGADGDLVGKVLQILRGDKSDAQIRAEAEAAGVSPEDIAKVAGMPQDEVDRRWENAGGQQNQPIDRSVDTSRIVLNSPTPMPAHTPAPMTFPNTTEDPLDVIDTPPAEDPLDVIDTPPAEDPLDVIDTPPAEDPIDDIIDTPGTNDPGTNDPGQGGTPADGDPNDAIIDTPGTPGTPSNPMAALEALGLLGGGGGYRQVNVKPGDLVDIKYVFDMAGNSAIPEYLKNKYARGYGMPYYSAGGPVAPTTLDELLALLRG